jgi:signal transduction histidine kinase
MGDAVNRADAVVGDLLEFAAPQELDLHETQIEPLIRQSLKLVKHELNGSKVNVVTNLAGSTPPCLLDRNKIKQVLVNLFTNACHAMPDGGMLTVTSSWQRVMHEEGTTDSVTRSGARFKVGDQVVVLEIADIGRGIPADQLSRVFDPYFTTKPTGKGTGLGLTVTKTIIDLHGGRISIANRSEGGVAVTIILKAHIE